MSTDTPENPESGKKSKKKILLIAVGALLILGGGGYWFVLKPPAEEPKPEPGEMVVIESIQINLAEDHYLKLGLALQATAEVEEELDGSKALDTAIKLFSGQPMEKLSQRKYRDHLKEQLEEQLVEAYHEEVMGVYFTDFVMQ